MADGVDQDGRAECPSLVKSTEPGGSRFPLHVRIVLIVLAVSMTGLAPDQVDALLLLI